MQTEEKKEVIVALLPSEAYWCKQDRPHVTIAYLGETKDLSTTIFNEVAKDAASISMLTDPFMVKVIGTDIFGDEEKVKVLLLTHTSELMAIRKLLEDWEINDRPYVPHATIGPEDSFIETPSPMFLTFNRIAVYWGEDEIVFNLRKL